MIDINLVPQNLRKRKIKAQPKVNVSTEFPKEKIIGLCGGLSLFLILVIIILQVIIFMKFSEHKTLKAQWEEILPNKTRVDAVTTKLRSLQGRVKAIENIIGSDKIYWSQKLNVISDNLPKGVWLKRIAFDEKVLFIEGSAVSKGSDEMINVHRFTANLKGQKNFMQSLADLEVGSIQRRKIKTVEIADYSIKARLK